MRIVADASAIAALYLPEKLSEEVEKALAGAHSVSSLDLAAYEVLNVVWKHARRGLISREAALEIAGEVLQLFKTLEVYSYREVLPDALEIALEKGVTVYDSAYVALAKKLGATLLTLDRQIAQAFPQIVYKL
ncbi:type II toxin-antitoxin system VapC family toxin [Pyrobaculum sp.]|uniref:type II toxin-antitoxin system VapC family toxin n=1 Tax=Pyrobaculum sp. TaxID=2004705 RepID=UPI003D0CA8A9